MLYVTLKWSDGYSAMRLSPRVSEIGRRTLRIAAGRLERPHTGLLNQVDERRRAAVHDRHFGGIQLDDDVVDPEADQCGEQMLDRIHPHGVAHQAGRVTDGADVIDGGRDLETTEIRPPETNAGTGSRRLEREGHLATRMQTNPRAGCGSFQCPLCAHSALWAFREMRSNEQARCQGTGATRSTG